MVAFLLFVGVSLLYRVVHKVVLFFVLALERQKTREKIRDSKVGQLSCLGHIGNGCAWPRWCSRPPVREGNHCLR